MEYRLSANTLNILNECDRCFWLHVKKGIKRARGIYPGLPGGMDNVLKKYFDLYREEETLPRDLKEILPNSILWPNQIDMNKWRNWRTGPTYTSKKGITLVGALDDLLVDKETEVVTPLDYKTRGYPPKGLILSEQYYGVQMSLYSFLLQQKRFTVSGVAYLLYYWPIEVKDNGLVQFEIEPVKITADPQRAVDLCVKAKKLLADSKPPKANIACEYCGYVDKLL